jgi:hypothetical protein
MHLQGETALGIPAHQTFSGLSLMPHARRIKHLIQRSGACTILDYGSGKGQQYSISPLQIEGEGTWSNLVDYWEVAAVYCYDPHYEPFSRIPSARYDGVICTDVLEHCPEEDLPWILEEIFRFAGRFVFASVACYSARKRLPNGENAHCTVRPPAWWRGLIERTAAERGGGLLWEFIFVSLTDGAGNQLAERLANWEEQPSGAKPEPTSVAALELEQATRR